MTLALLADPMAEGAVAPLTNAANELVRSGVLGAILVLIMAYAFYATMKWNKANEARVDDHEKMGATLSSVTVALQGTIRDLTESVRSLNQTQQASLMTLAKLEKAFDGILGDVVKAGIRSRTSSGEMPRSGGK